MEESKEPEKPEIKVAEEEQPSRTEEDREVQRSSLHTLCLCYCGTRNMDVSIC